MSASADDQQAVAFNKDILDRTLIALPLLEQLDSGRPVFDVVIDVNLEYPEGRDKAQDRIITMIHTVFRHTRIRASEQVDTERAQKVGQYVFARLSRGSLLALIALDAESTPSRQGRAIYRIWPDFEVQALIHKSIRTIKADAARVSFSATGDEIVWAVLDSGIHGEHPHFALHSNLDLDGPLRHEDFTGEGHPLRDGLGHGTHVAGIIAGECLPQATNARLEALGRPPIPLKDGQLVAHLKRRDAQGQAQYEEAHYPGLAGVAPRTKLISMKVLNAQGKGAVSNIISALARVQEINGYGRRIRIHGVNLSVGYPFDAEWFACGQSPLCVEVNQLVRSGVTVVIASGNTGYGVLHSEARGPVKGSMGISINDPGNADLAITVGSTHRDMPHVYGVSYFSSKGPTGDGRLKPDLVAPGERILSSTAGKSASDAAQGLAGQLPLYLEDSGTSMAAPHVSGAIAAFLSVRREFIGQPEVVKRIFLDSATSLGRELHFQGRGLVDLMRAIQSI